MLTRCRPWLLRLIKAWKILFQIFQFGQVVVDDVGIIGIVLEEILMVALGGVESLEGLDFCDDGPRVYLRGAKLRDIGLSDTFLLRAGIENCRSVFGAC